MSAVGHKSISNQTCSVTVLLAAAARTLDGRAPARSWCLPLCWGVGEFASGASGCVNPELFSRIGLTFSRIGLTFRLIADSFCEVAIR